MTAMDRIKEIELIEPQVTASNGLPAHLKHEFTPDTVKFILKAFRVMNQVAMHIQEDFRLATILIPEADKCKIDIVKEFEERMKE